MRTTVKKYGLCALAAVVLLSAAMLVTGCPDPGPGYQPSPRMGAVQLNFNKTIARATYLPDDKQLEDFADIVITFTGPGAPDPKTVVQADFGTILGEPIPMNPGTYALLVTARFTAGDDATIAAYYANPSIEVNLSTTPVEITLRPFIKDFEGVTGTGTFVWKIKDSTDDPSATFKMDVISIGSGDPVAINGGNSDITLVLENEPTGEILDAGFYYVDITVVASGETRYFRHVLHIYTNMTSTFEYEFFPDHIVFRKIDITLNIIYEHTKDVKVTWDVVALTDGVNNAVTGTGDVKTPYIFSLSDTDYPKGITFTVTNVSFTSVEWFAAGNSLGDETSLTVDDSVFDAKGPYLLTAVVKIDGIPYSAAIYIVVVE